MEREVRKFNTSDKDGGYFSMEGDGAYAHKYHNLEERSRLLSVFEALQLMINFSGLIVAVLALVVSIIVLKDKK